MLLYSIDEKSMIEIFSKSMLILFKSNDIIYYQNSIPLNLFLVLKGKVCFRKYSNLDLLAMITGEENIIISKKYLKKHSTKMTKKNMIDLRHNAFFNGIEELNNKNNNNLTCGDFFGEENIMTNLAYENCAIAKNNTIILAINLDNFNYYFREKIAKTKENIRSLIFHRFSFFKQVEKKQLKIYLDKIYKIYPKNGEIICKENELSNKLYLIFQGKCAVQKLSKNLGNILFLNKGDLFGYDSLMQLPEEYQPNQKINILYNEYTIINKDDSTIILILDIPFCDDFTTWRLNINLLSYFQDQKKIIQKYENFKTISTKILQDEYKNLDIRKIKNENNLNNLNKEYKNCFKKAIASEKNDITHKNSNKRKVNLISQYFKKFPKNYFFPLKIAKNFPYSSERRNNKENNNKIKIIFNSFHNKSEDQFITPTKNKNSKHIIIRKNQKKSASTISTNNISNRKTNNIRRFSTYSKMSTVGESKYTNRIVSSKYKIISNKNNNINTKFKIKISKKNNNECLTNDNKQCSKFDYSKINTLDEYLPFILSQNLNIFPPNQAKSTLHNIKKEYYNVYNYPFFYKNSNSSE